MKPCHHLKLFCIFLFTIANAQNSNNYYHRHRSGYNNIDSNILATLNFDLTYSGDVANLLPQIKQYDSNLHILRSLGRIRKIPVNIDLQGVGIDDLSTAINDQTGGQVAIIYDVMANAARLNYTDKFDVGNDAVNESLKWQNGNSPRPILKRDGVVRFPYGEYQPIVICQPLNLCDIELQAGEEVEGIVIGDSLRWNEGDKGIPIVYSGIGSGLTPHLVLKASQDGLDTTLLATTSKRTYMIRLKSRNNGYVARSGFYYPDELIMKFNTNKEKLKAANIDTGVSTTTNPDIKMPLVNLSKVNYNYTISGDNYSWKPTHVFDDGISVYIQMPDGINSRSLPGLCVLPDGVSKKYKCEIVNFRYNNHFYIVDKLFNQAILMNGFDDTEQTIEIDRNPDKLGFWARLFGK